MCASSLAAAERPFAAARLKSVGAGLRRADMAETAAALAFAPVILLAGAVIAAAHERFRVDAP